MTVFFLTRPTSVTWSHYKQLKLTNYRKCLVDYNTYIIALKASGRDCTNNNELLHIIGVLQRYVMELFLFTRKLLQAIRWRSK